MFYTWTIIGAGPSGIAAIGKLIDQGIAPKDIAWIDSCFSVGDFGTIWREVPSNTTVKLFLHFLRAAKSFNYKNCPIDFEINHANPLETCYLELMAKPLQWVTDHLKEKVNSMKGIAENLSLQNRIWHITLKGNELIHSKNVILAIGAEPKNLAFNTPAMIPLQHALNMQKLSSHVNSNETIAVFGSSHSAVLALRNLVEHRVKKIINFYLEPLRYAVYLDNWILFDDTGLKGTTADWAREHIDGTLPANLERHYSNRENIEHILPQCDKVIYAVGFERRALPIIQDSGHLDYVNECGIIAPGLFGIGIAFPQAKTNPIGLLEYRVGLWKFMEYLNEILPIWLKYST